MDEKALQRCRERIEQRLGWGNASDWTTREFEDLSLRIQDETGSAVSATTLKRVWGRVAYHSRPSRHTLDTLVAFLDYPSWRAFTESVTEERASEDALREGPASLPDVPPVSAAPRASASAPTASAGASTPSAGASTPSAGAPTASAGATTASTSATTASTGAATAEGGETAASSGEVSGIEAPVLARRAPASARNESSVRTRFGRLSHWMIYAGGSALILLGAFALWPGLNASPDVLRSDAPDAVRFDSRPVSQGLPNTVIFEYDVGGVAADSFFIQQSWDDSRRASISPERQTFTSTYYEPGYFNATLIADTTVLSAHPVHVTTDGWLALVESDPVPIYVPDAHVAGRGYFTVSEDLLRERGTDGGSDIQIVSFNNVRTFDSLRTDSFTLDTVVRHGTDDGRYPCRRAEIAVVGERGAIALVVGIPGCAGDLSAMFGDVYLGGSNNDLSALGADFSTWQHVQIAVKDRNVRVQVGSNAPLTSKFSMDVGRIVGLQYRFGGNGAIDHVALKDVEGRVVYEEAF